jgi:hypothetical protein
VKILVSVAMEEFLAGLTRDQFTEVVPTIFEHTFELGSPGPFETELSSTHISDAVLA